MAWSKLESRLISCTRIDYVTLPAEKNRTMVDGLSPLRGKCIGSPGLLWRKKLCDSIQSAMVFACVLRLWICTSSMLLVLPDQGWCTLRSPIIIAGRLGWNLGSSSATA
jgi:hypothetical protein